MKHFTFLLFLIFAIACNSEKNADPNSGSDSNSDVVDKFLNNVTSLEDIENVNSIVLFQEKAKDDASEIESLKKDNIKDFLLKAKKFKYCVITVGDHTIVKVKDFDNCTQSGSWAACMPFVEGYIKKGELTFKEDYLNNIIGLPDSQQRTAYLFN